VISTDNPHNIVIESDIILLANFKDNTGIEEFIANGINIYPNPTSHSTTLSFELEQSCNIKITLFDALGNELLDIFSGYADVGLFTKLIHTTSLYKGTYYLKFMINNMQTETSFIVK